MDLKKLPSHQNEDRGYIGWSPHGDAMMVNGSNWTSTLEYPDWESFAIEFENADTDFNVVVNFYFSEQDEDEKDSPISLNLWMLHPRKGASRGISIKSVHESNLPRIKKYLKEHRKIVDRWFAWVND